MLEPERQPASLLADPPRVITVIGEDFEIDVELVDDMGVPFDNIPAWADTTFTGSGSIIEVNGNEVVTIQPGVTDLGIEIAGLFENIMVRIAPRLYMTQSVQRLNRTIRIVAGRTGIIRVFLQDEERNIDDVFVELYQNGSLITTLDYPAQSLSPRTISDNVSTLDLPIPGQFMQPGLAVLVKLAGRTYPENGTPSSIDVLPVPEFHIRLIPIQVGSGQTGNVNSGNIDLFMEELLAMFPVNEYIADLHAPIIVGVNPDNQGELYNQALRAVRRVWIAEGRPDYYYYGVIPQETGGTIGLGYVSDLSEGFYGRQAVGWDRMPGASETLAHELGHNFGRLHAPCGGAAGIDPRYPYPGASIGTYGYEVEESQLKSPEIYKSFMSYCSPTWISDYTYTALLEFHLAVNDGQNDFKASRDVLLVSGQINNGELILDPAFRISAPPLLPKNSGPYTLSGLDEDGNQLFSISFSGARVSRGDAHSFAFAIPVDRVNIKELEAIRLQGRGLKALQRANVAAKLPQPNVKALPNISANRSGVKGVTLQWSSSRYKMAMVKNAQTGEVLGFTRSGASEIQTDASQLKLYFSDGVHTTTTKVSVQ